MPSRSLPLRTAAVFVLIGFLILLAAACTGPLPERSTAPSGPAYDPATDPLVNPPTLTEPYPFDRPEVVARDDTLVRYMLGDPRTLNPIFAIFWEDYYLSGALFQALTTRNADMTTVWNQTMVEEGAMADDWMSARVRIRPGLTWHDGKPWTMHDLKFTYDMVASDDVPAAMYKHDVDQIERIDITSDLTVEFHFKDALVTNMLAMRVPPIPRHIWNNPEELANDPTMRSSEYFNHYAREEVIGSGPYRFVSWTLTDRIVVDRWDDFPDAARIAPFRRVIYRPQSDRNLGLLLFKKGELDEYWFTPQQFATQSNDEEFERFGVKGWAPARRISRIGWNQDGSNPFFTDVRVRRAMTHAYDQKRVIRDVAYGVYLETDQLWDKDHMGYNPDVPKYPFDLRRVGELLDEAGWLSDPDDGWRYKEIGGEKVKFSFELEIAQTFADAVKMADIYREDLRGIGVELTLRQYENATHEQHLLEHEFQAHAALSSRPPASSCSSRLRPPAATGGPAPAGGRTATMSPRTPPAARRHCCTRPRRAQGEGVPVGRSPFLGSWWVGAHSFSLSIGRSSREPRYLWGRTARGCPPRRSRSPRSSLSDRRGPDL
ncbi:MAG: ABC transporter substrate-binding protein [Acidobacteriota bacterium]|nr:ABC transporter substrate-binding protein [Acidobacteriota bacterium]